MRNGEFLKPDHESETYSGFLRNVQSLYPELPIELAAYEALQTSDFQEFTVEYTKHRESQGIPVFQSIHDFGFAICIQANLLIVEMPGNAYENNRLIWNWLEVLNGCANGIHMMNARFEAQNAYEEVAGYWKEVMGRHDLKRPFSFS